MVTDAVQKGEREREKERSPLQSIVCYGWRIGLLYSHYILNITNYSGCCTDQSICLIIIIAFM